MKSPFHRGKIFAPVSLRVAFIVPFISLILLTIASVGYLSFVNGQKAVNNVAHQLRNEIILRIEQHLRTFLETPHQIIQLNANAIQRGWLDSSNTSMLQQHFLNQVQTYPSITSVYFGNINGGIAGSGREGAQGSLYIYNTKGMQNGVFNKYGVDGQGNATNLLSTFPSFDARTRPWYLGASQSGDATWSSVYILFTGQDLAIAASRPVYDRQQNLLGVVSVDIFLSQLSDFLKTLDISPTGQSFIMERSGFLVATSSGESLFTGENGGGKIERMNARNSETAVIREAAIFIEKALGEYPNISAQQQLEFKLDGERQFLQLLPVQDEYGIDWIVVVVIPESAFMAQIDTNNRITLTIIVLALIASIAISIFITGKVAGRVSQLNQSTQALAKGEWDQQLDTSGQIRELNALASSFNRMEEQLRSTLESLKAEIRERKQAEEALRESEKRFRSFFDDSPISLWEEDFSAVKHYLDGLRANGVLDFNAYLCQHPEVVAECVALVQVLDVNKATLNLYGAASKEDLVKNLAASLPEAGNEYFRDELVLIASGATHFEMEMLAQTRVGRIITVNLNWVAVPGYENDLSKTIVSVVDITERKQAEETLKEYSTRLETAVEARTHELRETQEKLVRQEKLAVLGQLAGGVGHELRNPLGVINNAIYYLRIVQPDAEAKVKEYLGIIEQEARNADKIISDLLDFSRIKSVDVEPVVVPDLVRRTLERFPVPENIQVTLDLPEDLPLVYVDPRQIMQVLGNLVVNACQAMPKGGELFVLSRVEGTASSEQAAKTDPLIPNPWVLLTVKDTGAGITPENMKRLFEPLFTTKTKGIGLGLAVSKKLIEANNGKIEVESESGKGATFTVYLPVKQ